MQGRLSFTTLSDLPEGAPVMSSTFSVLNHSTIILFDSGASHSFVRTRFNVKYQLPFCHTKGAYMIATLGGKVATYQLAQRVPISLGSQIFKTRLLILELEGVDIILGTDWMTKH
jgi:hypothetical protein